MSFFVQFSGLFLGVLSRTLLPYFRKLKQGKIRKFNKKYLYTAIGSVIISVISVILLLPEYEIESGGLHNSYEGIKLFCSSFAFGFAWNSILNESSNLSGGYYDKKTKENS